ncbi:ribonuclease P protein component [Pusillimonas sp. CC-YST705]|uniref:Ribonuclease P protein component n=2 Tax=Mesopusillimonas faecipullorum TaxID=2755040 RepID=A0ABS8CFD1_9BURK|nr:ribonuclease P protein component [Mesopusillimonas faecipullorum]
MTTHATLPSAARLHRPSEYAAALKGRRVARGALFVLNVPRTNVPESSARLGMIVAKRLARRAVTRNTIKRVLREAFRAQRHALPQHDFVFRLVAPIPASSLTQLKKLVRAEADVLLTRALKC